MNSGNAQTKPDKVSMSVPPSIVKSSSFTNCVELVSKMPPMSNYTSMAAVANRRFSITSVAPSRSRSSYIFPTNADYLSRRRLSHNRISAM
ncbi:hypothetical protein ACF0H5_020478 [Mactra antiquata]